VERRGLPGLSDFRRGCPAANGLSRIFDGHWERWMAERLPVDSMLDPLETPYL